MDPEPALRAIAFELERAGAPTYRVRAFRRAAQAVRDLGPPGCAAGWKRERSARWPGSARSRPRSSSRPGGASSRRTWSGCAANPPSGRDGLRAALRGDCHVHSDWSDGGSPPREMAEAARDLGHEWMALTDHSPRLTVARGLSAERLEDQLGVVSKLNAELAPFRVLTGIEVDILDDGALDQREDLLGALDVVVASVHSRCGCPARDDRADGGRRPEPAGGRAGALYRPDDRGPGPAESDFDADAVFAACAESGVAVEINCRPERQDPPERLLRAAAAAGCLFAIDTDAHAPGQLDWLGSGCARASELGIGPDRVINARSATAMAAGR